MQVGTSKDQGLYNKPSAAVHPGALAAGTLPKYNTIQYNTFAFLVKISQCETPTTSKIKLQGFLYLKQYTEFFHFLK